MGSTLSAIQNANRKPAHPVGSVDRALTLLTLLGRRERLRVSEAAKALGTAPSTAHRLLAMLTFHGFARQDPETRAYSAGPALLEVGLAAVERLDLRELAREPLIGLSEELDETVHLTKLQGSSVIFLDSVEASRALRIGSRAGRFMPAHCTASGRALLALLSSERLHALYQDSNLERMTDRSPATLEQLERELSAVRARGYAINQGESEEGVAAVAVAVPTRYGTSDLAITVSAPLTRFDDQVAEVAAAAARRTALELGARLDGRY